MVNNKNNLNSRLFTTGSFIITIVVIFLVFLAIYIYRTYKDFQNKKKSELDSRLVISDCPDYWDKVGEFKCKNNLRVNGKCNTTVDNSVMDFDNEIFKNPKFGNKFKCKWARDCGITWSGINSLC